MARHLSEVSSTATITVALAGNPNSGKTSLFNRLTGGRQHVGNYPGVTVEKKWGRYGHGASQVSLVDLPGTYSLTAQSEEERVARAFLINDAPDLVVDVIDASNLERNFYLAVQLMELEVNLVIALNMIDAARGQGMIIDTKKIEVLTGAPVVETEGHRGGGVPELKTLIQERAGKKTELRRVNYGQEIEPEIEKLEALLEAIVDLPVPRRYAAIKLLEADPEISKGVGQNHPQPEQIWEAVEAARLGIEDRCGEALSTLIADSRYGFALGLVKEVLTRPARRDRISQTERADAILTHRLFGLPIFLAFMYALFWLTFTMGDPLMGLIEGMFGWLGGGITKLWPDGQAIWLHSLIVDGIIGGVGGVMVFLPNIVLLFLGISILEDTGYMSRAAFIMDRVMHRFGLHGKSFIPMLIGFGCTIPAIMATRTLESRRDRLITMLILPFISCGARLPIYLLLIPAFFPKAWHAPVLWGLYLLGIFLGLIMARVLRKTLLGGSEAPFVMELPPYRMPSKRSIFLHMWNRSAMYLRKAGTIILGISIVLWALMSFPEPAEYEVDTQLGQSVAMSEAAADQARAAEDLRYSLAGRIGRALEPVTAPMGFDWRINTAFLGAFAAKEVFVAQMAIVFAMEDGGEDSQGLRTVLTRNYSAAQGLAILIFALLATPCMATVAITRRESGRWAWAALQWGGLTAMAYVLATLTYQLGSRLIG